MAALTMQVAGPRSLRPATSTTPSSKRTLGSEIAPVALRSGSNHAGSGTAVDPAGRNRAALAGKLSAFDPNKHYLAIFVWPDSFEHFGVIRDLMVDKRFEYRLVPFPADGKIYIGTAEGDVIVF